MVGPKDYTPLRSRPTSLVGSILTCMLDTFEKRGVTTVDIPGVFLQTKIPTNEKDVHVVLDRRIAELLAEIFPATTYLHRMRM